MRGYHQLPKTCLVIGAGISGLVAATVLQRNGIAVTVLEKSRGVGGRMATRRLGEARLDHGAQYFTVRDTAFHAWVTGWAKAGLAVEWFRQFPEERDQSGHIRWRGKGGMTDIPKALAAELDVRLEETVTRLHYEPRQWTATCASGRTYTARFLLLTAPTPQSVALFDTAGLTMPGKKREFLGHIQYDPCLTVLALLDRPSALPARGAVREPGDPLEWIADNQNKGISAVPALTLHSTGDYARAHWEAPDGERVPPLLEAARPWIGEAQVTEWTCHRWRYSKVITPQEGGFCLSRRYNVMFTGDGFGGPRVEGAALAGLRAAEHLVDFF